EHAAQTVVAAGFETADEASAYFAARTVPWLDCAAVDLTIDETNVLTLHYDAATMADAADVEVPEILTQAEQDMVLTSAGELSASFESSEDRKSTRLNSSQVSSSYAVFCRKKKR